MAPKDGNVITRKFKNFRKYIKNLSKDIYPQPPDASHTEWAIDALLDFLPGDVKTALDMGCGQGFLRPYFESKDVFWEGVTLGEDYKVCKENGLLVHEADITFLPFKDDSCDLIYARHVLEHSPCPIPTLMEWRRVSRKYLILICPAPKYWGYRGKNHYSVAPLEQLKWWLERSGWEIIGEDIFDNHDELFVKHWKKDLQEAGHKAPPDLPDCKDVEYRFLCEISEEVTE